MVAPPCRGKAKCPSGTCGHSYVTDGDTEQRVTPLARSLRA
jgi:hypothetical protein